MFGGLKHALAHKSTTLLQRRHVLTCNRHRRYPLLSSLRNPLWCIPLPVSHPDQLTRVYKSRLRIPSASAERVSSGFHRLAPDNSPSRAGAYDNDSFALTGMAPPNISTAEVAGGVLQGDGNRAMLGRQ